MKDLTIDLKNDLKLKFYGLYKVATVGKYEDQQKKTSIFSFFDITEKYKT